MGRERGVVRLKGHGMVWERKGGGGEWLRKYESAGSREDLLVHKLPASQSLIWKSFKPTEKSTVWPTPQPAIASAVLASELRD